MTSKIIKFINKTIFWSRDEIKFFIIFGTVLIVIFSIIGFVQSKPNQVKAQNSSILNEVTDSNASSSNGCNYVYKTGESLVALNVSGDLFMYGCKGSVRFTTLSGTENVLNQPTKATSEPVGLYSPEIGYLELRDPFPIIDSGFIGMTVNSSSALYEVEIASPKYQVEYYANRAKGKTFAADMTSGENTFRPMFNLMLLFRNIAYGMVIIILLANSLALLLGTLLGEAQNKVTIFQLLINTVIAIILITFWYQIASIIYDLFVNWANAIVASILEPYLNAKMILMRLQPGGDLNLTALLGVYQFQGLSESFTVVLKNLTSGLFPTINQTYSATTAALPTEVVQWLASAAQGLLLAGFANFLYEVTTSKAFLDLIISWAILSIQVKLFLNLLIAFISLHVLVAFGPLSMLNAVAGKLDQIQRVFMLFIVYCLVFPLTLFFILLSATTFGFTIPGAFTDGLNTPRTSAVTAHPLCAYSVYNVQQNEGNNPDVVGGIDLGVTDTGTFFPGDPGGTNAAFDFRVEKLNQRIFNVVSNRYFTEGDREVQDCRSKLFPLPFSYLPVPLGSYGNGAIQVQTTDAMVRTGMSLAFLILAMRAKGILQELLGVEEFKFTQGLESAFTSSIGPTLAFVGSGISAVGTAGTLIGTGAGLGSSAVNKSLNFLGRGKAGIQGRNNAAQRLFDKNKLNLELSAAGGGRGAAGGGRGRGAAGGPGYSVDDLYNPNHPINALPPDGLEGLDNFFSTIQDLTGVTNELAGAAQQATGAIAQLGGQISQLAKEVIGQQFN